MTFSIIVPVYNVEKYICECVDSILSQNYRDFEVILVDDGSNDNSGKICDDYKLKDKRIKVIHKTNGGISDARNTGLLYATGDYILFIDSDDFWVNEKVLDELNNIILKHNSDIVLFKCINLNSVTNKKYIDLPDYNFSILEQKNKEKILHYLFSEKQLPGGPNVYTVKRSIIEENNLKFITGIKGEDYDWNMKILLLCNKFYATNTPFYVYRQSRNGSITTTADLKSVKDLMVTISKWTDITNNFEDKLSKSDIRNYLAHIYSTAMIITARLDRNNMKQAVEVLKKYRYVLDYLYWKRLKIISLSNKILGTTITCIILKICYKLKSNYKHK